MTDSSRSSYWNKDYLRYWKSRVDEANSQTPGLATPVGDVSAPPDLTYQALVSLLEIPAGTRILEMGCGFGRTIPFLHQLTPSIDAVDISEAMIEAARAACQHLPGVSFQACEAEHTPFEDGRFARVICFGVFDALFQLEALLEINRILEHGGRALVTGKNDNYCADDELALVAEQRAREKGHPNFFTDVALMLGKLPQLGFSLLHGRYFIRRGDMAAGEAVSSPPESFYEFALVLQKGGAPSDSARGLPLSSPFSKTFRAAAGQP